MSRCPKWTEAQDNLLRSLIAQTPVLSSAEIGQRFSPPKSRNAIIGRCARLKVKLPLAPNCPAGTQRRKNALGRPRNASLITLAKSAHPLTLPAPLPLQIEGRGGITVTSLTARTCRWPIGDPRDPDFCFCGHEPMNGSPYCAYHVQIGTQPREKKAAGRVTA